MSESARRIVQLQRELASNPGSRQFYQLGELLRREGRSVEAAQALRSGLAHHPRYVAAWVALGRACVEAGQAAEAIHGLEQAIALDAQNPVAWRLLGEAYLAVGDRSSALDAMKNCLDLVPGDEVLQSAVDALSAEPPGAPAQPATEEPHEAEPFGVAEPNEATEVLAGSPEAEAVLPATPAEAIEAAEALPFDEPVPTFSAVAPLEEVKAAVSPPPEPVPLEAPGPKVGQETAEDLFGELAPLPQAPPPVAAPPVPAPEPSEAAPAVEAPEARPLREEELFTAPETEEGPVLLKKVLQASVGKAALEVPAQPPASLTLARLYVQQQALDEAVRVLERLLEREPGNSEARDLLALVRDMMGPLPAAPPPLSLRERKIAALQRWLASLTLGRERATR